MKQTIEYDKRKALEAIINYRKVLADKLSFDYIDENIRSKIKRHKVLNNEFKTVIDDPDEMNEKALYYGIGFVFDEATNGSNFLFLLNDLEFMKARSKAMDGVVKICALESEDIEKYIDFGIEYSKKRLAEKLI